MDDLLSPPAWKELIIRSEVLWDVVFNEEFSALADKWDSNTGATENEYHQYIPDFRYKRRVVIDTQGFLRCSCCLFARCGYGCVHLLAVILFECPGYAGYTHHDVCVYWWRMYNHYACRGNAIMNGLDEMFQNQFDDDVAGPRMPDEWNPAIVPTAKSNLPPEAFDLDTPMQRLQNYQPEQVNRALRAFAGNTRLNQDGKVKAVEPMDYVGYSQESYHPGDDEEDDDDIPMFSPVMPRVDPLVKPPSFRERFTPKFNELASLFDAANLDPEKEPDLEELDNLFDKLTVELKQVIAQDSNCNKGQSIMLNHPQREK